jgi:hypothetical protein
MKWVKEEDDITEKALTNYKFPSMISKKIKKKVLNF